ncbi:hypothetical protein [Spirosoma lituiforme]
MKTISTLASALLMLTLSTSFGQTPKPTSITPKAVTALTGKPASSPKAVSTTAPVVTKTSSTTAASSTPKASTTSTTSTLVQSTGPNLSLKNLITQALQDDSTRSAKKAGTIGVGLTYYLNGSLLAGAMVRQRAAYFTAGVGLYANKTSSFTPVNDVLFYGGGGLITSRQVSIGGYLSVTMVSSPAYASTPTGYEAVTHKTPTFGLGVSAGYQLNHVLISANIHNQFGLGLGATYFF